MMVKKNKIKRFNVVSTLLISLILMVCLSVSSFAWDGFQTQDNIKGFNANLNTGSSGGVGYYDDGEYSYTFVSDGSDFQPMGFDADNDGLGELIGSDSTYLKIWNVEDNVLVLEDELSIGSVQVVPMTSFPDYDGDSYEEFVGIFGTDVYVFEFNGTNINIEQTNTTTVQAVTGVICGNYSGELGCYWGSPDGNLSEYDIDSNVVVQYNISSNDIFNQTYSAVTSPAQFDIDRDGAVEFVFVYDNGAVVVDQQTASLDTGFDGDGIRDLFDSYSQVGGVMIANVDDAGDSEIIVTHHRGLSCGASCSDSYIHAFKSDGSTLWFALVADEGSSVVNTLVSPPMYTGSNTFTGRSTAEICVVIDWNANSPNNRDNSVACVDETDGSIVFTDITEAGYDQDLRFWRGGTPAVMMVADYDENSRPDIVAGNKIVSYSSENTWSLMSYTDGANTDNVIPFNADDESDLELCGMNNNLVWCSLDNYSNDELEILTISSDTGNPTCINQNVTFTLTEFDDDDNSYAYLRVSCLDNGTFTDWSSPSTVPSVVCEYTSYGNFNVYFEARDFDHDDTTDFLNCSWSVDTGNCFDTGAGGQVVCTASSVSTGFNEYHISEGVLNINDTSHDGYESQYFDWEGSGCNEWTFMRGVCPAWKWTTQALDDVKAWIFGAFLTFLILLLIIVAVRFYLTK